MAATALPTIIFSHLPLDNGSMIGNFYFAKAAPKLGHHEDGATARHVSTRLWLRRCSHVRQRRLCLWQPEGHLHSPVQLDGRAQGKMSLLC